MSDKNYTRKSNVAFGEFKSLCDADSVFASMTDDQKAAFTNRSKDKANSLLEQLGRSDFNFDSIADAEAVLSPTASSNENQLDEYIEITFAEHSSAAVSYVSGTVVGDITASGVVDNSGSLALYTITMVGTTVDGRTQIESSFPYKPSFEEINTTSFAVYVAKGHSAFSIWFKKQKES